MLQKFRTELNVFNQFTIVLAQCKFKFCRYQAKRAFREIRFRAKRFCESSDWKIERAFEREQQREQTQGITTRQVQGNQSFGSGMEARNRTLNTKRVRFI